MNTQLKKGALELCVLALLSAKERYGYELVRIISQYVEITEGTAYPLLKRLTENGYVTAYLSEEPGGGPARKYYRITESGLNEKDALEEQWHGFCAAVDSILSLR